MHWSLPIKWKIKNTTLSEQFQKIPDCWNNSKKYHTVGTIPKSNMKIVEKSISIPLTHKYMIAQLSWLGTETLIKSGGP